MAANASSVPELVTCRDVMSPRGSAATKGACDDVAKAPPTKRPRGKAAAKAPSTLVEHFAPTPAPRKRSEPSGKKARINETPNVGETDITTSTGEASSSSTAVCNENKKESNCAESYSPIGDNILQQLGSEKLFKGIEAIDLTQDTQTDFERMLDSESELRENIENEAEKLMQEQQPEYDELERRAGETGDFPMESKIGVKFYREHPAEPPYKIGIREPWFEEGDTIF